MSTITPPTEAASSIAVPEVFPNPRKRPEDVLRGTINDIESDAKKLSDRSQRLRLKQSISVFFAVILSVAAPTLVTYFAQAPVTGTTLKLVVILLAAFAGATTILLNTFRWGEQFGHTYLGSLELQQLASTTELEVEDILRTVKDEYVPEKLAALNKRAASERFAVRRKIVESEVSVVTQQQRQMLAGAEGGQNKLPLEDHQRR